MDEVTDSKLNAGTEDIDGDVNWFEFGRDEKGFELGGNGGGETNT